MKTWVFNCSMILVLIILLSFPTGTTVYAGPTPLEFTVNSFIDSADQALDGVCRANVGLFNACTLRAALQEAANVVVTRDVVVNVPMGTYTLTLTPDCKDDQNCGDLDLLSLNTVYPYSITIIGTGQQPSIIDANRLDRVLHIGTFHKVKLQNLTLQGGRLIGSAQENPGAGIYIHDRGDIKLESVVVKDNDISCPVESPLCSSGGGIAARQSDLLVSHCQILGNSAFHGAAIHVRDDSADPDYNTTVTESTISGHLGSFNDVIFSQTNLRLINTTMTDNLATITPGYTPNNIANSGRLWVQNSTLVFPDNGVNVYNWSTIAESVQIRNSILLSLTDSEGVSQGNCRAQASASAIESRGANVFSDDTCNPDGDVIRDVVLSPEVLTDPSQVLLGPLQFNGGKVKTMAPMLGFVGIDRRLGACFVNVAGTDVPQWLDVDARDFPRDDGLCDSGAVEGLTFKGYLPVISR